MEHVATYIQSNLRLDAACIKLPCLAREFGVCETSLKRGFKEVYGIPVHQYIISQRMELAKKMLVVKKVAVKDIAMELGYTSIKNFSRDFKAYAGVGARCFRKTLL